MGNTLNHLNDGFEITISSRSSKNYLKTEHVHSYYELHYLVRGKAEYYIDQELIHVQGGDFLFIKKNLLHKTICEPGSERLLVCFTDEFLEHKYQNILNEFGMQKYMALPIRSRYEVEAILKRMENEYQKKECYSLEMCRCMLAELIFLFHRYCITSKREVLSDTELVILDAKDYIKDNYSKNITLDGLAERYAMSTGHFSRTFKRLTGFGVSEYITMVRLNNAERLLESGQFSVTEIAAKCGFNNSNYFSSVFKSRKGITPREYRKML